MVDEINSRALLLSLNELLAATAICQAQFHTTHDLLGRDLYRDSFVLGADLLVQIGRVYARIKGESSFLHCLPDLVDCHAYLLPGATRATAERFRSHLDRRDQLDRAGMAALVDALRLAVDLCQRDAKDYVEHRTPGWVLLQRRMAKARRLGLTAAIVAGTLGWLGWQVYSRLAEHTAYVLNADNSVTRSNGEIFGPTSNGLRGWVEGAKLSDTSLLVGGWVFDPAAPDGTRVLAFVNGKSVWSAPVTAMRPDVNSAYGIKSASGFDFIINVTALPHPVKMTFMAISAAKNAITLNCNPAACDVK